MTQDEERKARLASALRANLARRKAQGRARAARGESPEAEAPADAVTPSPGPSGPMVPKPEDA
ncbi:hypothetical protein EDC64_106194 [Aquabacter spiritensis]|uniref:Uncharacterized protein n=1 Tax=Aquabacter spiritensis TaxID=933073 RepID=A0A4R3LVZ6_9HYPH|nr:hypothetical protein EDC64_106194 [Aquabacter spiritensis]